MVEKKKLWCVAAEIEKSPGNWGPDLLYTHAADAFEARCTYVSNCDARKFKIVGIAPVVGYFREKTTNQIIL